jgi:hypothetical protein
VSELFLSSFVDLLHLMASNQRGAASIQDLDASATQGELPLEGAVYRETKIMRAAEKAPPPPPRRAGSGLGQSRLEL